METIEASDKYSDALEVTLAPSRRVASWCGLGAAATVGLLAATPVALGVRILLATWVACLALDAIRRALRRHHVAFDEAGIAVDGIAGTLRPGSFVAPWLAIVRWRPAGGRRDRTLLVSPDRMAQAGFRHLRVIVRNARFR